MIVYIDLGYTGMAHFSSASATTRIITTISTLQFSITNKLFILICNGNQCHTYHFNYRKTTAAYMYVQLDYHIENDGTVFTESPQQVTIPTRCRQNIETMQTWCRHGADMVQTWCRRNVDTIPKFLLQW